MEISKDLYRKLTENAKQHEFLYHFTSLDCLQLIVRSGKMMLRRLDQMADKGEDEFLPTFWKKKVFACCFTHSSEGKADFWTEYAKGNGVRLEFPNALLIPEKYQVVSEHNYRFSTIAKTTPGHKTYNHDEDWGVYDISKVDVKYLSSNERDAWTGYSNGLIKNCIANKSYDWEEETRIRISLRPVGWEDTREVENRFASPTFTKVFIEFSEDILRHISISVPANADGSFIRQVEKIMAMNPATRDCIINRLS